MNACSMQRRSGIGRLSACLRRLACIVLLCLGSVSAFADDIVVIGNPRLDVTTLTEQMVGDLYLGRAVQLGSGQRVEVVDLPVGHPVRDEFYSLVLGRDPAQIRAYWAKRIFTGKGSPPAVRPDEASVVRWVAEAPGRVGYVRASALTDGVKVLLQRGRKR